MGYVYTDYAALRVPDEDAADDVPADLSFLAAQLDTALLLRAESLGDRDSKFYDAPSGVICVIRVPDGAVTDPGKVIGVYIKTSAPGTSEWSSIWSPPTTLDFLALSMTDDMRSRGTPTYDPGVWIENEIFAQMKGAVARADGAKVQSGTVLGYLPSSILPRFAANDFPCATAYHSTGGAGNPKVSLTGEGSVTYYGPECNWVGLDSVRYFRAQD